MHDSNKYSNHNGTTFGIFVVRLERSPKIFTQISRRSSFISPQYRFEPAPFTVPRLPLKFLSTPGKVSSATSWRKFPWTLSVLVSSLVRVRGIFWRMPRLLQDGGWINYHESVDARCKCCKRRNYENLNRGIFLYPSVIKSKRERGREGIRYADYVSRNGTRERERVLDRLYHSSRSIFSFRLELRAWWISVVYGILFYFVIVSVSK